MEIEIRNWENYNPKRDQKSYTWLRLSNDILISPDLHEFEFDEKMMWVVILCEASKKNRSRVKLNIAWISCHAKKTEEFVVSVIRKAAAHGFIVITEEDCAGLRSCAVVSGREPSPTLPDADVSLKVTTPTNERTYGRTDESTDVRSVNLNKKNNPSAEARSSPSRPTFILDHVREGA